MKTSLKQIFTRKRIAIVSWMVMLLIILYTGLNSNVLRHLLFNQKIWVHRVDSIEKFNEVNERFSGIEIDVVYVDSIDIFDVTHPPDSSIGLTLGEYFKSEKAKNLHFWLDFKNLNNSNYKNSLDKLNYLINQYQINPQNIIVESPVVQFLNVFEEEGYKTSYYLPWPGIYKLEEQEKRKMILQIKEDIDKYNLKYISSSYHDYPIMKENFPNIKKLLWLTENEYKFKGIKEQMYLYQILLDDKVEVLLFKYDSKTGNR